MTTNELHSVLLPVRIPIPLLRRTNVPSSWGSTRSCWKSITVFSFSVFPAVSQRPAPQCRAVREKLNFDILIVVLAHVTDHGLRINHRTSAGELPGLSEIQCISLFVPSPFSSLFFIKCRCHQLDNKPKTIYSDRTAAVDFIVHLGCRLFRGTRVKPFIVEK